MSYQSVDQLVDLINELAEDPEDKTSMRVSAICKRVIEVLQSGSSQKAIPEALQPFRKVANKPHTFAINPTTHGGFFRDWEPFVPDGEPIDKFVAYSSIHDTILLDFLDYLIFHYQEQPIRVCLWDRKLFTVDPRAPHQIYCSPACKQAEYRSRNPL